MKKVFLPVCPSIFILFLTILLGIAHGQGTGAVPRLVAVSPLAGAVNVPATSVLQFTFDIAMEPNPAIGGIAGFFAGGVSVTFAPASNTQIIYGWSPDGKVLSCTFEGGIPSNRTVSWALNPVGTSDFLTLKSVNGVDLPTGLHSGSFQTVTGGDPDPDGCNGGPPTRGSVGFFKQSRYLQTGNANPLPELPDSYFVSIAASAPPADTVESLTVGFPNSTTRDIPRTFGRALEFGSFASAAELNLAYPTGNYQWSLVLGRRTEPYSFAMVVPAQFPSVPKITNLVEFEASDPSQDFTLRWTAFQGATLSDSISLSIRGTNRDVFTAPDPCIPRELKPTDTSIVIPANTLSAGQQYEISLTFSRGFANDTVAVPDSDVFGSIGTTTTSEIQKIGGAVIPLPLLDNLTLSEAGIFSANLSGVMGRTYAVQASIDLNGWQEVARVSLTESNAKSFSIPASEPIRFFRAGLVTNEQ